MKKKSIPAYVPRSSSVVTKVKKSASGLGLYAEDVIKKGTFIIEYYGPIITQEESQKVGGKYLFEINTKKVIQGAPRYNTARYINHSCRPNAESKISKGKVFIFAIKQIKPGEEIAYDYGKEYFEEHIKPYGCSCIKCTTPKKSTKKNAKKNAKKGTKKNAKKSTKKNSKKQK